MTNNAKSRTHQDDKQKAEANKPQRLYRSETDKIIGGVAGGLGEFLNVDPSIIRIIFVLLTVFGGSGILIYLILWIILPPESKALSLSEENVKNNINEIKSKAHNFMTDLKNQSNSNDSRYLLGILIITVGFAFLMNNFGFFYFFSLERFWPLILVILGLSIIFRK